MNGHSSPADAKRAANQRSDFQFLLACAFVGVTAAGSNAVARFREAFGDGGVRASITMPDSTAVATGAVAAIAIAFRRGAALQRETEGLV